VNREKKRKENFCRKKETQNQKGGSETYETPKPESGHAEKVKAKETPQIGGGK